MSKLTVMQKTLLPVQVFDLFFLAIFAAIFLFFFCCLSKKNIWTKLAFLGSSWTKKINWVFYSCCLARPQNSYIFIITHDFKVSWEGGWIEILININIMWLYLVVQLYSINVVSACFKYLWQPRKSALCV